MKRNKGECQVKMGLMLTQVRVSPGATKLEKSRKESPLCNFQGEPGPADTSIWIQSLQTLNNHEEDNEFLLPVVLSHISWYFAIATLGNQGRKGDHLVGFRY
jgi:hypothetical protein